jgi:hypothetical protein
MLCIKVCDMPGPKFGPFLRLAKLDSNEPLELPLVVARGFVRDVHQPKVLQEQQGPRDKSCGSMT